MMNLNESLSTNAKMSLQRVCSHRAHFSRRNLLTTAWGGLFFSSLASRLSANEAENQSARIKSVIMLWLEGGPSQLETFDPHPGDRIGGQVKSMETSAKGIQIADNLPQLAEQMHLGSLVRSVTGKEGDHERAIYNLKTGFRPDQTLIHPSLGAVVCHQINSGSDIPRHISILPGGFPGRGGYLGAQFDAFKIGDPADPVPDVLPRVEKDRYDRRVNDLLNMAEKNFTRRRLLDSDSQRTLHAATTQRAMAMMSSEQLDAFDVSQESASLRTSFGDHGFARGCLAAVRLVSVGVRCVEITLSGWDSHINNHSLQASACKTLDSAAANLLVLLNERELLDDTLVVIGGEFGRTPIINRAEGRDHWPHGFSMMLAGCGIRKGHVHGATAGDADFRPDKPAENVSNAVTIADIHATILSAVGLSPSDQLETPIGRPMFLSEGTPIASLIDA